MEIFPDVWQYPLKWVLKGIRCFQRYRLKILQPYPCKYNLIKFSSSPVWVDIMMTINETAIRYIQYIHWYSPSSLKIFGFKYADVVPKYPISKHARQFRFKAHFVDIVGKMTIKWRLNVTYPPELDLKVG